MNYTVGQKLWYVPTDHRWGRQAEVTVTRVGRKWVELDSGRRVEIGKTHVDGGNYSSPGSLYESKEVYEASEALKEAWWELKRKMDNIRATPSHMTLEKISQIEKIVFNKDG